MTLIVGQLLAGPAHGFGRMSVEPLEMLVHGAILIMVALDARHAEIAHDLQAFARVGAVAHDVADAGIMRAFLLLDVRQYHLEGIQIGVYIRYDRKLHSFNLLSQTRGNRPPVPPMPLLPSG